MTKLLLASLTILSLTACNGGGGGGGSSSSGGTSFQSVTHNLDYSGGTNLPGDCATTIDVSVNNEIFDLELPASAGIDFADFVESANSAASGIANYAAATNDPAYDEGACGNAGYVYDRVEVSVFGTFSQDTSVGVSGSFVYKSVCDNSGTEVEIELCSGNISK